MKTRMIAGASIALALGLGGVIGIAGSASAHTPAISATCSGLHLTANSYDASKANTWTETLGGVTQSGTFGSDLDKTFPFPQSGATTSWSATIQAFDGTYKTSNSGSVGPCGTPPPPAHTPETGVPTFTKIACTKPLDGTVSGTNSFSLPAVPGGIWTANVNGITETLAIGQGTKVTQIHVDKVYTFDLSDGSSTDLYDVTPSHTQTMFVSAADIKGQCPGGTTHTSTPTPPKHTTTTPVGKKLAFTGTSAADVRAQWGEGGIGGALILMGVGSFLIRRFKTS